MRKWLVGVLLVLGSLGAFAQAQTGYFDVLAGYQFRTGSYDIQYGTFRAEGHGKNNWLASMDAGWFFTEHVGLHVGYIYNPGKYKINFFDGSTLVGDRNLSRKVHLLEVGPEFIWGSAVNQGYAQVNVGHTFGSGETLYYYNGSTYDLGNLGGNEWGYGAALGYRHYFGDTVGLAVQGAYHHIKNWEVRDAWDVRMGIAIRFPKPAPPPPAPAPPPPPPAPVYAPEPAPAPQPAPLAVLPAPAPPRMITIDLDESVLNFAINKWAIPKEGEPALNEAVAKINEYPTLRVNVFGHTSSPGTAAWNATLSQRRAESVAKYLTTHGVDPSRLDEVKGKGPSEPIGDNKTFEGRAKNRRVQIVAVEPIRVPAK